MIYTYILLATLLTGLLIDIIWLLYWKRVTRLRIDAHSSRISQEVMVYPRPDID